jgi:hypothetical protein
MERAAWTDERLDDLARRVDAGFARVDGDIRDLRSEMGALRSEMQTGFSDVRGEMGELRGELQTGFSGLTSDTQRRVDSLGSELRGEIQAFRLTILRVGGGIMVGLVGVIGAVLVSA